MPILWLVQGLGPNGYWYDVSEPFGTEEKALAWRALLPRSWRKGYRIMAVEADFIR